MAARLAPQYVLALYMHIMLVFKIKVCCMQVLTHHCVSVEQRLVAVSCGIWLGILTSHLSASDLKHASSAKQAA